jgi:hypothetical protein
VCRGDRGVREGENIRGPATDEASSEPSPYLWNVDFVFVFIAH